MKKMSINGMLMDVVNPVEFFSNRNSYRPNEVAVQVNPSTVLPYRGMAGTAPGYYCNQQFGIPIMPTPDQYQEYNSERVVDFDNITSTSEYLSKTQSLKSIEKDILSASTNFYAPQVTSNDEPQMAGLREAITKKHIDINLYADRFGALFNNDKRLLNNQTSITFPKLVSVCNNLDMKATLIIEDKEGAPNPIGERIVIPLNGFEDDTITVNEDGEIID